MATLTDDQIAAFVEDGLVRLDSAFPRDVAESCCAMIAERLGYDPRNPETWTQPVLRAAGFNHEPFRQSAHTPQLAAAFDQLAGKGRWRPRKEPGMFVIRFPHAEPPGDTGWHVDSSFMGPESIKEDYSTWRFNVEAKGRPMLLLFLFSDVGMHDAPTRIRVGSHLHVAKLLEPFGRPGLSSRELEELGLAERTAGCPIIHATGDAGTVYICHPFLVHAAQTHQGVAPRVISQPELPPGEPLMLNRADGDYSPVERAIRRGLGIE